MRWGIKNTFCQAAGSVIHGIADYQSVCQTLINSNADFQVLRNSSTQVLSTEELKGEGKIEKS